VSSARRSIHKQSGNQSTADLKAGLLVDPLAISSDFAKGHLWEEGSTELPPALKSQAYEWAHLSVEKSEHSLVFVMGH
jgi:hypothetical protein